MGLYDALDPSIPPPITPATAPVTISGDSKRPSITTSAITNPAWSTPTFVPPTKRNKPKRALNPFGISAAMAQAEGAIIRAAPQPMTALTNPITKVSIQAPSMTLEEDVNGFQQTNQGKKANKRRKKSGGFGKGRREDAGLAFDDTEYDPSRPCDYAAYKIHVEVVRTQRRLNREEEERREDSDSYEESEEEMEDPTKKKPRFFAPPSSYDAPPTNADGTPIVEESMNPISAPRTETGEEAYLRRLAMSGQNPRPHSPPPVSAPIAAVPSFEPATSTSNSVGPRAFPSFVASANIGPQLPSSGSSFVRPAASSFYGEEKITPITYSAPPTTYAAPPSFSAPPITYSAPPITFSASTGFIPSSNPPPPLGFAPPTFLPPSFVPSASIAATQAPPLEIISDAAANAKQKAKEIAARLGRLASFSSGPAVVIPSAEQDSRPFAERFMAAHGWEAGQGIGAASDGRASALSVSKTIVPSSKFKGKNKIIQAETGLNAGGKGRGKIYDATREARLEDEEKKLGEVSRIVVLSNLVDLAEAEDEELVLEVTQECNLIGVCERAFTRVVENQVVVFCVMSGIAGGFNCRSKFDGRWFGGREVRARYYPEKAFSVGNYEL